MPLRAEGLPSAEVAGIYGGEVSLIIQLKPVDGARRHARAYIQVVSPVGYSLSVLVDPVSAGTPSHLQRYLGVDGADAFRYTEAAAYHVAAVRQYGV